MFDTPRIFRRSDPDFPTTPAVQKRLIAAGRVAGEGSLASRGASAGRCALCGCAIADDPDADPAIPACGSCKARQGRDGIAPQRPARTFTEAEKSLIRKISGYVPPGQLLDILNDRLRGDLGAAAVPYTLDQLHAEIAAMPGAGPSAGNGWAALRKVLGQARRDGTVAQIDEQVIRDFAVVFSLAPKHLMRLKDILLERAED